MDRDYWRYPCECDIEPSGCTSYGVGFLMDKMIYYSKEIDKMGGDKTDNERSRCDLEIA